MKNYCPGSGLPPIGGLCSKCRTLFNIRMDGMVNLHSVRGRSRSRLTEKIDRPVDPARSTAEHAALYCVTQSTAYLDYRRAGVAPAPSRRSASRTAKAIAAIVNAPGFDCSGVSLEQIALRVGVSRERVRQLMPDYARLRLPAARAQRMHDRSVALRAFLDEHPEAALPVKLGGMSYQAISAATGIGAQAVADVFREMGITSHTDPAFTAVPLVFLPYECRRCGRVQRTTFDRGRNIYSGMVKYRTCGIACSRSADVRGSPPDYPEWSLKRGDEREAYEVIKRKDLNDWRDSIEDNAPYVMGSQPRPYAHNIISLSLRAIADRFGAAEANRAIRDFKLAEKGWPERDETGATEEASGGSSPAEKVARALRRAERRAATERKYR